jgi:hypothetical protein
METCISIPFEVIVQHPFSLTSKHTKAGFIQELINKYSCFQEKIESRFGNSKWIPPKKYIHPTSFQQSLKERPKIGNKDTSKEAILTKDFQSLLNKLTNQNYSAILLKIKNIFDEEYLSLFIELLWTYLQKQPEYQGLYIKILESFYPLIQDDRVIEMGTHWNVLWRNYIASKKWQLSKELVEQSHNYQDFCDYVKEKKRLLAISQAWARLMNLGIVHADAYELLEDILQYIHKGLDIQNAIDIMCMECYIEQCRIYYETLSLKLREHLPNSIEKNITNLIELEVQKSCQFKIEKFVSLLIKNEEKINSPYDIEDDGL